MGEPERRTAQTMPPYLKYFSGCGPVQDVKKDSIRFTNMAKNPFTNDLTQLILSSTIMKEEPSDLFDGDLWIHL
jgi:hypothetical protein